MENFTGKIDLMKFKKSFVTKIQGKNETKACVCIPIEDNQLFVGEKGIYFDFAAWILKESKSGDSHIISQSFSKEIRESMTEEERKSQPILGSLRVMQAARMDISTTTKPADEDNVPF